MNNPCEQCIISMMCKDYCERLEGYMHSFIPPHLYHDGNMDILMYWMRISTVSENIDHLRVTLYATKGMGALQFNETDHVSSFALYDKALYLLIANGSIIELTNKLPSQTRSTRGFNTYQFRRSGMTMIVAHTREMMGSPIVGWRLKEYG